MAVNKYKVTFKHPATGELDSVIIDRQGQPTLAEVAQAIQLTGISTEKAFISASNFVSVEHDDTPEPAGSPWNYEEEAAAKAAADKANAVPEVVAIEPADSGVTTLVVDPAGNPTAVTTEPGVETSTGE